MNKKYKWGDCIQCGYCCLTYPCGMSTLSKGCEYLHKQQNGQYICDNWPFAHLDDFQQYCLEAHKGCGYGGNNPAYKKLFPKLREAVCQIKN